MRVELGGVERTEREIRRREGIDVALFFMSKI